MRLIISVCVLLMFSACAPDIPEQDDIDCGDVNCFEIASQLCDAGYLALCHEYNPRLIWCIKQLQSEDPSDEFFSKCMEFFMPDQLPTSDTAETVREIYAPDRP